MLTPGHTSTMFSEVLVPAEFTAITLIRYVVNTSGSCNVKNNLPLLVGTGVKLSLVPMVYSTLYVRLPLGNTGGNQFKTTLVELNLKMVIIRG